MDNEETRKEVEGKFPVSCNSLESIEGKIVKLGGRLLEEVAEEDVYYAHPCRDFTVTDEALRTRKVSDKITLTYKGPKLPGKVKRRTEIIVKINGNIDEVLSRLGFRPVIAVYKKRKYYELNETVVSIDIVKDLGCFVEIESESGDEDKVLRTAQLLGLYPSTIIEESYAEMIAKKEEARGK